MEQFLRVGYYMGMLSENARFLRQGLIDQYRKMTPAERVHAFIEHSKLMKAIQEAGAGRKSLPLNLKTRHD